MRATVTVTSSTEPKYGSELLVRTREVFPLVTLPADWRQLIASAASSSRPSLRRSHAFQLLQVSWRAADAIPTNGDRLGFQARRRGRPEAALPCTAMMWRPQPGSPRE